MQNGQWVVVGYDIYYYSDHATSIEDIIAASRTSTTTRKVFVDGKLRIVKGDRIYGIAGDRIK